uniref:Coatomer subunit beta n=1 Tax=Rhizophora mucronata TaxID=61149 RepID=A0A2P2MSI4_RHIMU
MLSEWGILHGFLYSLVLAARAYASINTVQFDILILTEQCCMLQQISTFYSCPLLLNASFFFGFWHDSVHPLVVSG